MLYVLSRAEDFHPANISAQDGSHAYLPCIVKRLGSKSVRKRMLTIMS